MAANATDVDVTMQSTKARFETMMEPRKQEHYTRYA